MVNKLVEMDDILEKAFHLAFFIHDDKESAVRIVMGAMTKLEVATAAQNKRRYYTPQGRSSPHRLAAESFRNKIAFSKSHLLQRLIYVESEPYEVEKEQAGGAVAPSLDDMLIHFIKHLVRISIRRNSFYVTLGINRLLYSFSTAETMDVYNLVVQDPERVKDDYYYRSRKGVLLHELKERFGNLVKTYRGPRGEERLHTIDDPARYDALVKKCLSLFTPWSTSCLIPANFNPLNENIALLSFQGQHAEDSVEINRIHAILHPDCFQRVIAALGFGSPDERLSVPHFFHTHDEGDQDGPRRNGQRPPRLDAEDLWAIKSALAEQAERRRKSSADLLRIVVDGSQRACLDLKRESSTRFRLAANPELIEVLAGDSAGELHLASHLFTYDEAASSAQPLKTAVVLEGKQKVSINIFFAQNADGEAEGGQVEIKYQERNPLRAASLFARQLKTRALDSAAHKSGLEAKILKPVLLLSLLAICLASAIWYAHKRRSAVESPPLQSNRGSDNANRERDAGPPALTQAETGAQDKQPEQTTTQPEHQQGAPPSNTQKRKPPSQLATSGNQLQTNNGSPRRERKASNAAVAVKHPSPSPEPSPVERERSRGPESEGAVTSLLEVKKVYLEIAGNSPSNPEIRLLLVEQLRQSSLFTLIENRDEADGVLKVSITEVSAANARPTDDSSQSETRAGEAAPRAEAGLKYFAISARMVNARGEVLWPAANRSAQYEGSAALVAARLVEALLGDIQRMGRER